MNMYMNAKYAKIFIKQKSRWAKLGQSRCYEDIGPIVGNIFSPN